MLLLSSSCSCSFSVLHLSKVPRKATRPSRIPFAKTLPGRRTQGFFILEVRSDSTPDQKYTVIFGQDGNRTKFVNGKIEQNDVKFLKYKSRHEICFQSLVVDTTIIIDQPTFLNKSCDGDDNRPCKKWASEIHPVPVCPEALTKLLKDKGDLRSPPSQIHGPNEFEPPVYDTTNDMFQASFDIAEGTSELFRKVVKHKWKALDEAQKVKFSDIGKKLGSFNSFYRGIWTDV